MKYIKRSIYVAFALFSLASCDLDLIPTTAIEKEAAFQTITDAEKIANGMTSYFRGAQYGVFSFTTEVQGDMFNAGLDYGNRNGFPHQMNAGFTTSDYNVRDVWRQAYKGISSVNNFLDNIGKIVPTTPAQTDSISKYKGQAYFYRAAYYHQLIRHFAKDYEPATAATDLGVPIVLKYDIAVKPKRATVAEVYAQIESDIDNANINLAKVPGVVRAEKPTLDAVKALNARVKLFEHKYTEAATLAQELIASAKYTLASTSTAMANEWVTDNGAEDIFQMSASLTEYGTALIGSGSAVTRSANNIYLGYIAASGKFNPDFIPTKTTIDSYEATDLRKSQWFSNSPCVISAISVNLMLFNKYPGNPSLFTAPTRTYAHKAKVFRIAEMYLIRAEALLLQAAPDPAGALTALNALQTARGATPTAATLANVQTEWGKETIGEGFRIDCLKRWHKGFTDRVPQSLNVVQNGTGFNIITVAADNHYFVWPIPQVDMDVNPNLVQNEGWY